MSNKIDDRLPHRIEIYLNLQEVCRFFSAVKIEEHRDYEEIKTSINWFQVFTNRADGMKERNIEPLIKQRGIKFNAKELEVENIFLNQHSKLSEAITATIEDYVREGNVAISCRAVVIHRLSDFEPDLWCKENLSDYENDGSIMVSHIYERLNDLHKEYSKLELLGRDVFKLYSSYFTRAKDNVQQIEKMYGRKLQYVISQRREIQSNFDHLFNLLKDIEERIVLQIEEHDAKIENSVAGLEIIRASVDSLCVKAYEIKDIVSSLDI